MCKRIYFARENCGNSQRKPFFAFSPSCWVLKLKSLFWPSKSRAEAGVVWMEILQGRKMLGKTFHSIFNSLKVSTSEFKIKHQTTKSISIEWKSVHRSYESIWFFSILSPLSNFSTLFHSRLFDWRSKRGCDNFRIKKRQLSSPPPNATFINFCHCRCCCSRIALLFPHDFTQLKISTLSKIPFRVLQDFP